jgi:hypothetical protein
MNVLKKFEMIEDRNSKHLSTVRIMKKVGVAHEATHIHLKEICNEH